MLPLRREPNDAGEQLPRILRLPKEIESLNCLTVGHVVLGFFAFRSQFVVDEARRLRGRLLDRQEFLDLEECQRQLDLGAIAREQFAAAVEQLIGDPARNVAFAGLSFWGAPFACRPRHRFSRMLRMTAVQRKRARSLFHALHNSIESLRGGTHQRIRAALNARQSAILDDPRSPLRARADSDSARPFVDAMIAECALDANQQAEVRVSCALLRTAVLRRHERARESFLAMLNESQRRTLDMVENISPPGSEADFGSR